MFYYGNDHRLISEEDAGESYNTHEWKAFIECSNKEITKNFISKVDFKLHPTFNPSKVTVNQLPLSITRWGWGVFEIKIVVHWKKWMNKKPTTLPHMLSFDEDGEKNTFLIDVNKQDYENL